MSCALEADVEAMMAPQKLQQPNPDVRLYSHIFLVKKVTGGWQPAINLSPPSKFVLQA